MQQDKAAEMAAIAAEVQACTRCRLHEFATKGVPGAGNINTEIMFIGEAPGHYEDKSGLPFVGQSGKLLEKLLASINLTRDDVFIGNVVKHRPPENRDPLPDEIAACKPYLDRQIALLNPLVIATLGRFSMAPYFPGGKITQIHGKPKFENGRAYLPLYHPAAVLRNPSWMDAMQEDFLKLPDVLAKAKQLRADLEPKSSASPTDDAPPKQMSMF